MVAAIKTGRYTHAKKAKDITEVKLLQAQQREQHNSVVSAVESESESVAGRSLTDALCISTELSPVQGKLGAVGHVHSTSPSCPLAVDDLEKVIEHITNVHLSQTPITADVVAALPAREKSYLVIISQCLLRPPTCLSVCLPVCLSVCLSLCLCRRCHMHVFE